MFLNRFASSVIMFEESLILFFRKFNKSNFRKEICKSKNKLTINNFGIPSLVYRFFGLNYFKQG